MTFPHIEDDLESALNPEPSHGFGQITDFGARLTGLWTGTRGVDSRLTEVDKDKGDVRLGYYTITPCDPTKPMTYVGTSPKRCVSTIGRSQRDWLEAVESIKPVLNAKTIADVVGRWVEYVWTPRKSNKPGEDWKYPKLIKVFKDQAECESAWQAAKGGNGDGGQSTASDVDNMLAAEQPQPKPDNGNGADAQRAVLAQFLPNLWTQANKDKTAFAALLAANPMIGKVFDMSSVEVVALVAEA